MNQDMLCSTSNMAWCISENADSEFREQLISRGFHYFELDATNVIDAPSFVRELVTHLPCDPDYYDFHEEQEVNWAAIEDSLFGGLMNEKLNIAIFWNSAEQLIEQHLNLIFMSLDILFFIARGGNFTVKVFLLGRGPNFEKFNR